MPVESVSYELLWVSLANLQNISQESENVKIQGSKTHFFFGIHSKTAVKKWYSPGRPNFTSTADAKSSIYKKSIFHI